MAVVYWHLGGYLDAQNYLASFFVMPGRLAVWIFFMMSGYLIGHGMIYGAYEKTFRGIRRFYINRLLRIYPIFFVVSIVSLLVSYSEYSVDLTFLAEQLFMLQWNHNYQLNSVFWTLGVEVHFYLIAPLLIFGAQMLFQERLNTGMGLYLLTLVLVLLYSQSEFFSTWDMRSIMGGITHFVTGIVCAINKDRLIALGKKRYAVAVLSVLVLLLLALFNHKYGINFVTTLISNLIGLGLISLHIILEDRKMPLNLLVRGLLIIGVLSYGIYAWHGFLAIYEIYMDNLSVHLLMAVMLAYLTYVFVERPLVSLKR